MQQHNYNNYGDNFLSEFTKPTIFRLINIKPDPDNPGGWLMPAATNVPATSMVQDKEGKQVYLALIRSVSASGEVEFDRDGLIFGVQNNGQITLYPDNPKDREKYNYLMHCHFNKNSPYTYAGAEHIVEVYDPEAKAKESIARRKAKRDAIIAAANLDDNRVASIYAVLGNPGANNYSVSEMREIIEARAETEPQKVLDAIGGASKKAVKPIAKTSKELVAIALSSNKIAPHYPQAMFKLENGQEFFKYVSKKDGGGDPSEQLVKAVSENAQLREKLEELTGAFSE